MGLLVLMVLDLKFHQVTSTARFASSVVWKLLMWDPTIVATISGAVDIVSHFPVIYPILLFFFICLPAILRYLEKSVLLELKTEIIICF